MTIPECQALLATTLSQARCSNPPGSPAGCAGQSVLRMASAYESDGRTFLARDDPVNALAAFLYGLGWLHCGIAAGLLVVPGDPRECPFAGKTERLPVCQVEKLTEKTERYARLLATALGSITPAPESGTPIHAFALQVQLIAGLYLQQGRQEVSAGNAVAGLTCFSYGHGWLDAGVEAGLFSIRAHREIFTVD